LLEGVEKEVHPIWSQQNVYAEELDLEVQQKSITTSRSVGYFKARNEGASIPSATYQSLIGSGSDLRGGPTPWNWFDKK
jgi:hypothetical protein